MKRRPGYTLLEVMLALAIGLLLVAALYIALDVQFRYMQSGRNAVAEGQLARGLLARIAADVRLGLGALPKTTSSSSSSTTGAQSTQTQTSSTSQTGSSANGESSTPPGQFNQGVVGDEANVMLFLTTVPRFNRATAQQQTGLSDLRRVTYQLVPDVGLMRHESRLPQGNGVWEETTPPEILAHEVMGLQFRYFDAAQGWLPMWDGTTCGPPQAVEITLLIQPFPENNLAAPRPPTSYRAVVAIPTGSITQETVDAQAGGQSP